jgi:hypothetical protein
MDEIVLKILLQTCYGPGQEQHRSGWVVAASPIRPHVLLL